MAVEGSFWEENYEVRACSGAPATRITKELFDWTDTYVIDAEKCSRNNH